uniref:alpha-N-acetylgalactosaminide alpha-2,6-sialyltransferase n=1 Tax=Oryzias latipes TaxID=8090 RepID=A0A3B3IE04_ORYLA
MAVRSARLFSFLVLMSLSLSVLIFSMENLGKNVRSKGYGDLIGSDVISWQKKSTTSSRHVFTTASQAKTASKSSSGMLNVVKKTMPPQTETPIPIIYRKSFSKLPQWDFEDAYNQDTPPRLTTCAQSLRNSKDEAFQKAFLPNISLFLHKNRISMTEWNRLSHFNNPFGFMDYKYDDIMASVKLIPKPKEPLLSPKPGSDGCVRCAVVANGGILNGSKMGAEIDAHDYVFRMNAAVTKGYEEDVGNRTSVYVHTSHSMIAALRFFQKYGYTAAPHDQNIKYVMIPEGMRDFQWLEGLLKGEQVSSGENRNRDPRTFYSGQYNESRFYVLHQDFLRYVRNRFLPSKSLNDSFWAIFRPTNGAFTLFLALHTCDTVSAYGFMTEDYSEYSNYYVERDLKTKVTFFANHDYILEKDLWKSLHNRKIIKLHQRSEKGKQRRKKMLLDTQKEH